MTSPLTKQRIFSLVLLCACLAVCAHAGKPQTDRELKRMGMVVEYKLAEGASRKDGVSAKTDAGHEIFSPAAMTQQGGGGTNDFGGGSILFPRWVRVTWRKDTIPGERWTTGVIAGDYTVEVLDRIPAEVFHYTAAASGRVIVLKFRLKDDGVLFAWAVQETSANGQAWVYKMEGGDF